MPTKKKPAPKTKAVSKKKSPPDEIKAKHVLGGMTLKDVWPLVRSKCESITLVDEFGIETVWSNFTVEDDIGLDLWESFDDEQPEHTFPPDTAVRVKDNHIKLDSGERLIFNSRQSIRIKIL